MCNDHNKDGGNNDDGGNDIEMLDNKDINIYNNDNNINMNIKSIQKFGLVLHIVNRKGISQVLIILISLSVKINFDSDDYYFLCIYSF